MYHLPNQPNPDATFIVLPERRDQYCRGSAHRADWQAVWPWWRRGCRGWVWGRFGESFKTI